MSKLSNKLSAAAIGAGMLFSASAAQAEQCEGAGFINGELVNQQVNLALNSTSPDTLKITQEKGEVTTTLTINGHFNESGAKAEYTNVCDGSPLDLYSLGNRPIDIACSVDTPYSQSWKRGPEALTLCN